MINANTSSRLLRRDRVPRLSARLWIVRLISQIGLTAHSNAGVTVTFFANPDCANRMQRHVASLAKNSPPDCFCLWHGLRLKHGRSASYLKSLPRTPCFCASSYSLHPPPAAIVLVTFEPLLARHHRNNKEAGSKVKKSQPHNYYRKESIF